MSLSLHFASAIWYGWEYLGTEEHHLPIRLLCMRYILNERAFFQDYVTDEIENYARIKSEPGQWGDDVEI